MVVILVDTANKRLQEVINSQESIETTSMWVLHHSDSVRVIVDCWLNIFRIADEEKRVALFYLMNDVVQRAKKKHLDAVCSVFEPTVIIAVNIGKTSEKLRGTMERCLNLIDACKAFSFPSMSKMRRTLEDPTGEMDESLFEVDNVEFARKIEAFTKSVRAINTGVDVITRGPPDFTALIPTKMRDRKEGSLLLRETQTALNKIRVFKDALSQNIVRVYEFIDTVETAKRAYNQQLRDVAFVEDAYVKFGQGIREVQEEVGEMIRTGVYPAGTPPRDAPSPSAEDDVFAGGVEMALSNFRGPRGVDVTEETDMEVEDDTGATIVHLQRQQAAALKQQRPTADVAAIHTGYDPRSKQQPGLAASAQGQQQTMQQMQQAAIAAIQGRVAAASKNAAAPTTAAPATASQLQQSAQAVAATLRAANPQAATAAAALTERYAALAATYSAINIPVPSGQPQQSTDPSNATSSSASTHAAAAAQGPYTMMPPPIPPNMYNPAGGATAPQMMYTQPPPAAGDSSSQSLNVRTAPPPMQQTSSGAPSPYGAATQQQNHNMSGYGNGAASQMQPNHAMGGYSTQAYATAPPQQPQQQQQQSQYGFFSAPPPSLPNGAQQQYGNGVPIPSQQEAYAAQQKYGGVPLVSPTASSSSTSQYDPSQGGVWPSQGMEGGYAPSQSTSYFPAGNEQAANAPHMQAVPATFDEMSEDYDERRGMTGGPIRGGGTPYTPSAPGYLGRKGSDGGMGTPVRGGGYIPGGGNRGRGRGGGPPYGGGDGGGYDGGNGGRRFSNNYSMEDGGGYNPAPMDGRRFSEGANRGGFGRGGGGFGGPPKRGFNGGRGGGYGNGGGGNFRGRGGPGYGGGGFRGRGGGGQWNNGGYGGQE